MDRALDQGIRGRGVKPTRVDRWIGWLIRVHDSLHGFNSESRRLFPTLFFEKGWDTHTGARIMKARLKPAEGSYPWRPPPTEVGGKQKTAG